jgi:predicted phosphodiesterase
MGSTIYFDGEKVAFYAGQSYEQAAEFLPKKLITVSAWVSIDQEHQWGGIVGMVQDNANAEKGWVLGYNQNSFYFGLAGKDSSDADGTMTYLAGETKYEKFRLYHVVGVYDGGQMQIYVNGKLDGVSDAQKGEIFYPKKAPYVVGAYQDDNEFHLHKGQIREVAVYDLAAKAEWAAHEYEHSKELTELRFKPVYPDEFEFLVEPYLQFASQTSMTVMWETNRPARSVVNFGETSDFDKAKVDAPLKLIHEMKLTGLKPNTPYYYKVETTDDRGQKIESEVFSFQTACGPETPFGFAVISDTQDQPKIAEAITAQAWEHRPRFIVHPGDLVGTGANKAHWTQGFFPALKPMIERMPFYPVLGNHEGNAKNYYDYVSLPGKEYYYTFKYGNAQFFMIDSNKKVGPGSEQYLWLEKELAKSTAEWKFVSHHHPPFSSDENDYGNLWKGRSALGDARVREITALYDKYGVDIVWNGHIHSYERTWPISGGKVVERDGTIYMITGGGGGHLETPGPIKPDFQNNVRRGHHFVTVAINGGILEMKAFDIEGRLYDYLKIEKR